MKASEIAARLAERVDALVPDLLPEARRSGAYWHAGSTAGERGGSLYLHRVGPRRGKWVDAATGEFGDLLDLVNAVICSSTGWRRSAEWAMAWLGEGPERAAIPPRPPDHPNVDSDDEAAIARARAIWSASSQAAGWPVANYLRYRAIATRPPVAVRYHGSLACDGAGRPVPAAIYGLSDATGRVTAVQAVFLRPDGQGKAGIAVPKRTWGRTLASAVRLAPASDVLGLAEGVETGLSAMELHGVPVWAACGARMSAVAIPTFVRRLLIFADNGLPGIRAAERAATMHETADRAVEILCPPAAYKDFNDQARARAERGAA